jgi:hypothetical protein
MVSSAQTFEPHLEDISEDLKLTYFRKWLRDFTGDASAKDERIAQFQEWLGGLTDRDIVKLHYRHYHPTYLNLLSVFKDRMTPEEIHTLAVKSIKSKEWSELEFFYHFSKLPDARKVAGSETTGQCLLKLKGWKTDLINSLLARGKGLMLCSFRMGLVRFLPVEVALLGYRLCGAMNAPTAKHMQLALDSFKAELGVGERTVIQGVIAPENIHLLTPVNVEEKTGTVQLVDALKRGEVVGLCVEGNTGMDGPWGQTSKSVVKFLGHTLSVKNGAARLAAAMGTPLLPVVALRDEDDFGSLVFGDPIIPDRDARRLKSEKFAQETMQTLYDFLESFVLRHPEQWEAWSALHRWRLRDEENASTVSSSDLNAEALAVVELLRGGSSFKINDGRVAQLPVEEGVMWVDLKTLKGYRNPSWAENILQVLSGQQGLNLLWVDKPGADPAWKEKVYKLLAYLKKSEIVITC